MTAFENSEKPIVDLLDRRPASVIGVRLQMSSALRNFKDLRLAETRELGTTASEIEQFCSLIAKRLRALGTVAQVTPQRAQACSFLDPYAPVAADDEYYICAIDRALAKLRSPRGKPGNERQRSAMRLTPPCSPGSQAQSTDRCAVTG